MKCPVNVESRIEEERENPPRGADFKKRFAL
jgi:hypothetical protein